MQSNLEELKKEAKKVLMSRYNEIMLMMETAIKENTNLANTWGKVHTYLGSFAALFSTISAILTFFDNQAIVILLALLSATLAALLTSLNPSSCESRRRQSIQDCWTVYAQARKNYDLIHYLSDDQINQQYTELLNELERVTISVKPIISALQNAPKFLPYRSANF